MSRRRRGFLFTMPLMLGMGILIFSSMIAISQLFVGVGGPMVPDLLADMPTIFHYADDGTRIPQYVPILDSGEIAVGDSDTVLSEQEFAELFPSIAMYGLMVKIAIGIFVILIMLAGVSYFFEEFNLVRPGTAYGMLAKLVILVPIYLVLPYLWDTVALVIESSSLYLMDPFGGDPHARTTRLWCLMGSVACSIDGTTSIDPVGIFDDVGGYDRDDTLNLESWNESLQNPLFGEDLLVNVILSLFKGFAVMFMTAMMFVLSAVRVMLTEIIIVSFPLVTAIGLIPWINTDRISSMFQQNLVGLAMAPVLSALVLSVGISTIDSQELPPLRMWFQLLSVGFLAVFFPVMLSPMLGNLSTRVGSMVSSSITSASVAGSGALRGMTHGAGQASAAMRGVSAVMGGAAASGAAAGSAGNGFSSASVGSATSGASLGRMSVLDKMRVYGRAGAAGFLGGLGSGMVQSTAQPMGLGPAVSGISGQMIHGGDAQIRNTVHGAVAGGAAREIARRMASAEHAAAHHILRDNTLVNPGESVNAMMQDARFLDAGRSMLDDPAARERFLDSARRDAGLDGAPPEARKKFDDEVTRQIRKHPVGAGRMSLGGDGS